MKAYAQYAREKGMKVTNTLETMVKKLPKVLIVSFVMKPVKLKMMKEKSDCIVKFVAEAEQIRTYHSVSDFCDFNADNFL